MDGWRELVRLEGGRVKGKGDLLPSASQCGPSMLNAATPCCMRLRKARDTQGHRHSVHGGICSRALVRSLTVLIELLCV